MGCLSKIQEFLSSVFNTSQEHLKGKTVEPSESSAIGERQDSESLKEKETDQTYKMPVPKRGGQSMLQAQKLKVYIEKSEGMGEDAEPILDIYDNKGVLAVFDGLGGSGSVIYQDAGGASHSGAFLAARMAQRVMIERWQEFDVNAETIVPFLDDFESNLQKNFQKLSTKLTATSGKNLKGSTLKNFPTTIACIIYCRLHAADLARLDNPEGLKAGSYQVAYTWAGDSRCYLLHPVDGLQQLTKDDTVFESDAYTSLYDDPPISKTINAEEKINLNRGYSFVVSPSILFVCSDGCYNYLETPMHFEQIMLASLISAESMDEWSALISATLGKVAGDDVSLSLVGIGWKDFGSIKKSFEQRFKYLEKTYIDPLRELQVSIHNLEEQLELRKKEQGETKVSLWMRYKQNYSRYLD